MIRKSASYITDKITNANLGEVVGDIILKKAKEKLEDAKLDEKVKDAAAKAKDAAQGVLDKTDLDEKLMDAAGKAKDKAADMVSDLKDKVSK